MIKNDLGTDHDGGINNMSGNYGTESYIVINNIA